MYALSLGVQQINQTLPPPVYALLSGLNAATVGIIALAAVQLSEKAIRDRLTRLQVILGACAGLCYNALWYFPLLMVIGGLVSVVWDGWMAQGVRRLRVGWCMRARSRQNDDGRESAESVPVEEDQRPNHDGLRSRRSGPSGETLPGHYAANVGVAPSQGHVIRIRVGVILTVLFFSTSYLHDT